jgi:hypothetical protein
VLAAGQGAYAGGAKPQVYVLWVEGSNDEVYVCNQSTPATTPAVTPNSAPGAPTKIMVVVTEAEIRGCTFVDPIDETIVCPQEYSAAASCMAYRAHKQGGNTVLTMDKGKVYNCPSVTR